MNTTTGQNGLRPLAAKILLTLLSIPLMRVELLPGLLPHWFSDYSYGLMFRLGVFFGLVVLMWRTRSREQILKVRNAAFLLASVASALLAVRVGSFVNGDYDLLAITISGAVCLAFSHRFLLGCSWIQAIAAMVVAPGLYYLTAFVIDKVFPEPIQNFLGEYLPFYWQLGYLLGMFGVGALLDRGKLIPQAANS